MHRELKRLKRWKKPTGKTRNGGGGRGGEGREVWVDYQVFPVASKMKTQQSRLTNVYKIGVFSNF